MKALNLFNLEGKMAVVTGCSKGIGREMAIALAEAGADIIGVSSTLGTKGSQIEQEITALGRRFIGYSCDFSQRDAVYDFIHQLKQDIDKVDVLINNAGTIIRKPVVEHSDEMWDNVMDINLNAPFILSREIGKDMVSRRAGKIIFTASLLTFQGGITVPGYAASKGAIGQLTKALANEWASLGVQVNAIAPGYIETDVTVAIRNNEERNQAITSRIPAGRWGKPEDFKGVTVFLASDASNYVNGEIITVDGGWMAR